MMVEVNFYHLQKTPLAKSLPRLLEKLYASQARCVVLFRSSEELEEINTLLWTYSQSSFLPHGCSGDKYEKDHPILLTTHLENPNQASILVVIEGKNSLKLDKFEKCLDVFNGYDEESVSQARKRWQNYKEQGYHLTYWFQNDQGSWSKQE